MKKFFYYIAILASLSLSISSCIKEEVKPHTDGGTGGAASPIKI
jgi:hypothetical protein